MQEALTNVVKHARTSSCQVLIGYGRDELVLEVTDNGAGAASRGRGAASVHGSGCGRRRPGLALGRPMRPDGGGSPAGRNAAERAAGTASSGCASGSRLLGGEFSAGPRPGYGFRVIAHIPLPADQAGRPRSPPAPLRVVVADDQALVRVGFCGIIAATPGFAVVGEAANGAEAIEAARRAKPDVILMDVRMPVMDGIEATRQITASTTSACSS